MAIFIKYWVASTSHVDPQRILQKIDADDFSWFYKRIRHLITFWLAECGWQANTAAC
jgi:hypothetical protein